MKPIYPIYRENSELTVKLGGFVYLFVVYLTTLFSDSGYITSN
jgi:hypothetical protein